MLDRILAAFAAAILDFLAKRIEHSQKADDATQDPEMLRRAGERIRERMRQSRPRAGVGSSPSRRDGEG